MKTTFILFLLWFCRSAFAAIGVSVPTTYTQNFDTLPKVAGTNWTDNVTIPGWWLHRDGATPPNPAPIAISNGSGTWAANLYSLGATGAADRALGFVPTTAHGAYSFILIF